MEDKCVCCGEYVPEGRQVCSRCETVHGAEWIKNQSNLKVKLHEDVCKMLNGIYEEKNLRYKDSYSKSREDLSNPILYAIYHKFHRLKNLLENPNLNDFGESVDDTLIDISNYCIMELIERRLEDEREK